MSKQMLGGGEAGMERKLNNRYNSRSGPRNPPFFDQDPPPQASGIERSIIAACILSAKVAQKAVFFLEVDDFYLKKHQVAFQAIKELTNQGEVLDLNIILEKVKTSGHQNSLKASYLAEIIDKDPVPPNVETSCKILKQKTAERQLLNSCKTIAQGCYEGKNAQELIEQAQKDIDSVKGYIETTVDQGLRTAFRLTHLAGLEMRSPDWLISNYMECDSLGLLFGDPESCKSFAAVDIASSVSTATNFHDLPVKQGPVAYFAGEGQNGIKRRFLAWAIRHHINIDDAPIYLSSAPANLCDPDFIPEVLNGIQKMQMDVGNPVLIVIDTVARNFGPGDENSTQDMNRFIAAADKIRIQTGATVLLIHHSGHGDKSRARGAMALKGALDFEFRMTRTDNQIAIECTKMKDTPRPEPIGFEIRSVELGITDENGDPITSAILDRVGYEPNQTTSNAGRGKWQITAIRLLHELVEQHRGNLAAGGYNPDQARVRIIDWREKCYEAGMDRRQFHKTKKSLENIGSIKIDNDYVNMQ